MMDSNQKGLLGMFNVFAGGAVSRMAIFALGIMPYISSSIIVQLLTGVTDYFKNLTDAAATDLFQIIGHTDLPKKFGFVPEGDCVPLYRNFLTACADTKTCIELNTAGLRKDCTEIYPHPDILKLARQLGVQITFGSDAHAPKEVGMDLDRAVTLARECGYEECCRFEKRKKSVIAI